LVGKTYLMMTFMSNPVSVFQRGDPLRVEDVRGFIHRPAFHAAFGEPT
jgi:hypothetical protein